MQFLYVMDPMCAWCYGFQPELDQFLANHPLADVNWIMGGLAPDTKDPMGDDLKHAISSYWHEIEQRSQVRFNHDYWELNTPFRSTYQACRAVISAEKLIDNGAQKMVKAIQSAYYLEAKNPSLDETLLDCAKFMGIEESLFLDVLNSQQTEQQLQQQLNITRYFEVNGFPALIYVDDNKQAYPLTLGFCKASELDERFKRIHEAANSITDR